MSAVIYCFVAGFGLKNLSSCPAGIMGLLEEGKSLITRHKYANTLGPAAYLRQVQGHTASLRQVRRADT